MYKSISYGVSQDKSSGFIAQAERKSKKIPAPDHYNLNASWVSKKGQLSKSARITEADVIIKRESKLPGPGSYNPKTKHSRLPGFAMDNTEGVNYLSNSEYVAANVPGAGKYEPQFDKLRQKSPHFRIVQGKPKKAEEKSRIGPGSYNSIVAYQNLRWKSPRSQRFSNLKGRDIF